MHQPVTIRAATRGIISLLMSFALGCVHIGPPSIVQDRLSYNEALATSAKEQILLNIVRLRYVDTPVFVDVAQIVAGYTLANTGGAGIAVIPDSATTKFSQLLGGTLNFQQAYSDRPTISYAPLTHSKFVQNLTLPLPPQVVLYLMQAGYPVDLIFELTLDSINGLRNNSMIGGHTPAATAEFQRVCQIFRKAQLSGHVGMHIEVDKDKKESLVMSIHDPEIDPVLEAELAEARRLLRMDPKRREVKVVFGTVARGGGEIAIMTRSMYRILANLSAMVEVPDCDAANGVAPTFEIDPQGMKPLLVVHCGCKKPECSFTSVCYRGTWFWIESNDTDSKRTMVYLIALLALADAGTKEPVPFLTIQAN